MEASNTSKGNGTNNILPPHLLKTSPYNYKPGLKFNSKINFEVPFVNTPLNSKR